MRKIHPPVFSAVGIFCLLFLPHIGYAHQLDFVIARTALSGNGNTIQASTSIPYALPFPSRNEEERRVYAERYFQEHFKVSNKGEFCNFSLRATTQNIFEVPNTTDFVGTFTCADILTTPSDTHIENDLFWDVFRDLDHFITLTVGGDTREILFDKETSVYDGSENTFWGVLARFVKLGVEHILTGYDHILFVIAVILVIPRLKDIAILVTSFTVAHSLTLIMAALGLIVITARIVEPLIALSIAYMAIRNISPGDLSASPNKRAFRERWAATFGFGLIHGLGFAGALAATEIPKPHFFAALLSFNGGVEIGQFLVILAIVPLLRIARKRGVMPKVVLVASGTIAVLALGWFLERVLS